jgi:hypothetical protein
MAIFGIMLFMLNAALAFFYLHHERYATSTLFAVLAYINALTLTTL